MFNENKSRDYIRKLRLQKFLLIGLSGLIGCGIIAGYLNFHNQVSRYMQSVVYREKQEATKDYTAKLMKINQQLLAKNKLDEKQTDKRLDN